MFRAGGVREGGVGGAADSDARAGAANRGVAGTGAPEGAAFGALLSTTAGPLGAACGSVDEAGGTGCMGGRASGLAGAVVASAVSGCGACVCGGCSGAGAAGAFVSVGGGELGTSWSACALLSRAGCGVAVVVSPATVQPMPVTALSPYGSAFSFSSSLLKTSPTRNTGTRYECGSLLIASLY